VASSSSGWRGFPGAFSGLTSGSPWAAASLACTSSSFSLSLAPHSLFLALVPAPTKPSHCPQRFFGLPSLVLYPSASTLSLVSCCTTTAPALPPSRRRSPDFLRKPGTPPRPITEGTSLRPPIGVEPAFFHKRGCWPNFSKRSPGGASRPRVILPGPSLSVGSGGVVILPPSHKQAQFTGGLM
jgi:hypothetical protein